MEKIILYDWVLEFINENYNIRYTIEDLNNMLWPKIKNLKTNYEVKNYMVRLHPSNLIDRLFNWETCKINEISFKNINYYWQDYCMENDIDDFNQVDIFPKKIKIKINFDC